MPGLPYAQMQIVIPLRSCALNRIRDSDNIFSKHWIPKEIAWVYLKREWLPTQLTLRKKIVVTHLMLIYYHWVVHYPLPLIRFKNSTVEGLRSYSTFRLRWVTFVPWLINDNNSPDRLSILLRKLRFPETHCTLLGRRHLSAQSSLRKCFLYCLTFMRVVVAIG